MANVSIKNDINGNESYYIDRFKVPKPTLIDKPINTKGSRLIVAVSEFKENCFFLLTKEEIVGVKNMKTIKTPKKLYDF